MNDSRLPLNIVFQYRGPGSLIKTGVPANAIDGQTGSFKAASGKMSKKFFKSSTDKT